MPTSHPRTLIATSAIAAALLVSACGSDPTPAPSSDALAPSSTSDTATVTIELSRFAPTDVEISVGGTVDFVNLDPYAHTVTAATGGPVPFDSGAFGEDETFTQGFDAAGSYDYFCEIHPTMRGTVTVS